MQKRKEDLDRITSTEGIQLRMNRSIQAEGSFAELKAGMDFRRFLCRGKANVLTESILLGIAQNKPVVVFMFISHKQCRKKELHTNDFDKIKNH